MFESYAILDRNKTPLSFKVLQGLFESYAILDRNKTRIATMSTAKMVDCYVMNLNYVV